MELTHATLNMSNLELIFFLSHQTCFLKFLVPWHCHLLIIVAEVDPLFTNIHVLFLNATHFLIPLRLNGSCDFMEFGWKWCEHFLSLILKPYETFHSVFLSYLTSWLDTEASSVGIQVPARLWSSEW